MKIRPLQDWAVLQPRAAEEKTAGGIVIPDVAQEEPQEGTVLAIGEGHFEEDKEEKGKGKERKFVKTVLKPGARVVYRKYAESKIEVEGEEIVMVRERDILGVYES